MMMADGNCAQVASGYVTQQLANCHDDVVSSVDVCVGGNLVVTGSWDATVKVFEKDGKSLSSHPTRCFYDHETAVTVVSIHPKGTVVVSGSVEGTPPT